MILIGLAGQSCAGKNEAGFILKKWKWHVIDADVVSRHLFSQNQNNIIKLFRDDAYNFGVNIENDDGSINKRVFSSFIFSKPQLLSKMEEFILPKIEAELEKKIENILKDDLNAKIAINAPTLHKTFLFSRCSYILYIKANFFVRFYRALKRDKCSLSNIWKRFFSQRSFESQYIGRKSDILAVVNNSTISKLESSIEVALKTVGLF